MHKIEKNKLAKMIDHTNLRADAQMIDMERACQEAIENGFAAVCVNPSFVRLVADRLKNSQVKVCTVVGFPLGASDSRVKAFECERALEHGAQEIDMVINVGMLKDRRLDLVKKDIGLVVEASSSALVKVIIETCYLTDEEKLIACQLAKEAGADFVKSSTGLGPGGANVGDIALMSRAAGSFMGVKASGGIRSLKDALAMIEAGATRIGTSSGIKIIKELEG